MFSFQRAMRGISLAAGVFLVAGTALADIKDQTVVLQTNTAINLDSGATVSTGGDLRWTGTSLAPQGTAKAYPLGSQGDAQYNLTSQQTLQTLLALATTAAIPLNQLPVGELIDVGTNGGNVAKVEVTAIGGGTITLKFTTYGNTTGAASNAPTITALLNNSSRVPAGYPNYGLAPSSLFVIQGTGMSDPGAPVLQDSAPGLQTTLNGASISVTVNNITTHPAIYYTSPTQIAAVLPAATPVGNGTLTVTYKGVASAAFPIKVIPSALGFTTFNGSALATDAVTGALLTYTQSGKPGDTIILWSTGLGADPADSDTTYTSTPHTLNTNLQLFLGSSLAKIVYQGASVYPGVSVIGVVIPTDVQTGCYVSMAAVIDSNVSNITTLPIASDGGVCQDPYTGLNGSQITQTGAVTKYKAGSVAVFQGNGTVKGNTISSGGASASLQQVSTTVTASAPAPGGCILSSSVTGTTTATGLDGGTITMTPPGGAAITLPSVAAGAYSSQLSVIAGGVYTFQGSGGSQVGPFTATVTVPGPSINWTNQSSAVTVNRAGGLQVTWTGGGPGTLVNIVGASASSGISAGFFCLAHVEAGQFTVPSYVLLSLPAGSGNVQLINNSQFGSFSASGLDLGSSFGSISFSVTSTYN